MMRISHLLLHRVTVLSISMLGVAACSNEDTNTILSHDDTANSQRDSQDTDNHLDSSHGDDSNGTDFTTVDTDENGNSGGYQDEYYNKSCEDKDSDGWCVPWDCNDDDPAIHPGALETEDGKDNDCNGLIDDLRPENVLTKKSYIWIANSVESTVSKVNTETLVEEARYKTCPYSSCDPSRTSVNLYGDMVVTNRHYSTPVSSVTKIKGFKKDCTDKDGDGVVRTSENLTRGVRAPLLPWGQDECVVWNQELSTIAGQHPRARATAWDGTENPETGDGGKVLIGTCLGDEWELKDDNQVYVLDGDSGDILSEIPIENTKCFYGGAMALDGGFWIMDGFGIPDDAAGLIRVGVNEPGHPISRFDSRCGYGITADSKGNIWTGGKYEWSGAVPDDHVSCVQKFSVSTQSIAAITTVHHDQDQADPLYWNKHLRGIAVGTGLSEGFVWAVESFGYLYKIDETTLETTIYEVPDMDRTGFHCWLPDDTCTNGVVGTAVDWDGYVWVISTTENAAYRFDPVEEEWDKTTVGDKPYTYSDMTGMQLRNVVNVN